MRTIRSARCTPRSRCSDELRRRGETLRRQGRAGVEARIGVNTGEVVMRIGARPAGTAEYSPIGHAATSRRGCRASRRRRHRRQRGHARLVEGYFELRALGPTEVKGVSEPIDVYEVDRARRRCDSHFQLAARRGLTQFVGRERELEQMKHALELASGGHGQIVAVVAEAGTGKSRLFYEFKATIPGRLQIARSLLGVARQGLGVAAGAGTAARLFWHTGRRRCGRPAREGHVRRWPRSTQPRDTLPYLFGLLGIVRRPRSARPDGPADQAPAHARRDQAHHHSGRA